MGLKVIRNTERSIWKNNQNHIKILCLGGRPYYPKKHIAKIFVTRLHNGG